MNNELSKELSYAKEKIQYDTQCKRVLSQKQILAWILKRTVKEFTDLSIRQIIPHIEGTPEISSVSVYPGNSKESLEDSEPAYNRAEKISGMPNEDKIPEEGTVYFDIRFRVSVPQGNKVQMIINVEAQKSFYPGYKIVTRGIFYSARMISAQSGVDFTASDYDSIRKVYSIWLCMNAPKKIGNAISEYSFRKRDLLPGLPDHPQAYDKISVIIIALNEKISSEDLFIGMINTLLSAEIPYHIKKKRLEENYHIQMHSDLAKEVGLICNLSDYVEEQGIQKGIQEGIQNVVVNLLKLGTVSDEDIMKAGNLSPEELGRIKEGLKNSKV